MAPIRKGKRQDDEAKTATQHRRTSKRLKSHQDTQEDEVKPSTEPQESKGKGAAASPSSKKVGSKYPSTPDGHYFVVRGRLWRCADPSLTPSDRDRWTKALMSARRDVGTRGRKGGDVKEARDRVQEAKEALGERGEVWWNQGEGEVCDRKMVWNTGYKAWWQEVGGKEAEAGEA